MTWLVGHYRKEAAVINAFEKMAALTLALEDYKKELARRTFAGTSGAETICSAAILRCSAA